MAYEVRSRRAYWASRGLAALGFTLACAWSTRSGRADLALIGGIGTLLFGAFSAYAARQLLRRAARLTLSSTGFEAADLGVGTIPWTDVEGIEVFGSQEAPFIAFHVPDAAAIVTQMPWWPRMMCGLLWRSGLPLFSINLIGVDRGAAEVASHAHRLWRANVKGISLPDTSSPTRR